MTPNCHPTRANVGPSREGRADVAGQRWNQSTVSRDVHLNPDGVLVEHPLQWPWSSYPGYVDPRQRWPWVQHDAFLNAWQGTWGGDPIQGYRQFVESGLGQTCRSPFENGADGWILGGEGLIRRIRQMISPPSRQPTVLKARIVPPVTLPQIVATTCAACDISPEQLQIKGSRHAARYLIALLARQHSGTPLRERARVLGLQRADRVTTLSRSTQRASAGADFRRLTEEIRQRLNLR